MENKNLRIKTKIWIKVGHNFTYRLVLLIMDQYYIQLMSCENLRPAPDPGLH